MRKFILVICMAATGTFSLWAQAIPAGLGVDPENVCFQGEVYYGVTREAVPLEPVESIEQRLNRSVPFVRENPDFTAAPAVRFAVNCRGELGGGFHMATHSGNGQLDRQLLEFFMSIERWRPGEQNRQPVDSWFLWRMSISDGYIMLLNYIDD